MEGPRIREVHWVLRLAAISSSQTDAGETDCVKPID